MLSSALRVASRHSTAHLTLTAFLGDYSEAHPGASEAMRRGELLRCRVHGASILSWRRNGDP